MLKLSVSYSKKLPVPSQEFSSESCHAAVEVELPEGLPPAQLRTRIHEQFQLVRRSVEDELRGHGQPPAQEWPEQPSRAGTNGQTASAKQVCFLLDLGARQNLDLHSLNAEVQTRFGVPDVYALSRQQASRLIDELNGSNGQTTRVS